MLKTLKDVGLGSEVLIKEDNTYKKYILTRKDSQGCELLRKYACANTRRINSTNTTVYDGCELDQWLTNTETGFLSLFDSNLLSKIVNRSISTYTYGDTECHYIQRNCYLYSYGDMFGTESTNLNPEVGVVGPLMINRGTSDINIARIAKTSAEDYAVSYWLRSAYSATNFWYVYNNGTASNIHATYSYSVRPVLNVSSDTIVSDEGADIIYLLPEQAASGKIYLATENTVADIRSRLTPKSLDDILVYALDFVNDPVDIISGGLDEYARRITN